MHDTFETDSKSLREIIGDNYGLCYLVVKLCCKFNRWCL